MQLNESQKRTASIMRQIVVAVCDRRENKIQAAMRRGADRQKCGREIYGLQHIRERWLWTSHLERMLSQ